MERRVCGTAHSRFASRATLCLRTMGWSRRSDLVRSLPGMWPAATDLDRMMGGARGVRERTPPRAAPGFGLLTSGVERAEFGPTMPAGNWLGGVERESQSELAKGWALLC